MSIALAIDGFDPGDLTTQYHRLGKALVSLARADDLLARAARALQSAASGARNRLGIHDRLGRAKVMLALAIGELDAVDPETADEVDQVRVPSPRIQTGPWPRPDRATTTAARFSADQIEIVRHRVARHRVQLEGRRHALRTYLDETRPLSSGGDR